MMPQVKVAHKIKYSCKGGENRVLTPSKGGGDLCLIFRWGYFEKYGHNGFIFLPRFRRGDKNKNQEKSE